MTAWTGVALALAEPGAGGLGSRLSKYLHPLAGRPLAWHTLHSLASLSPAPESLIVVGGPELEDEYFRDLPVPVRCVAKEAGPDEIASLIDPDSPVLVMDAAAPALEATLQPLIEGPAGTLLEDARGRTLAAWLSGDAARQVVGSRGGVSAADDFVPPDARFVDPDGFIVESRGEFARASVRVRDRLVRALMDAGATFLLPDTVLVDVDVRIGRDAVIYPNVVLEGQTTIGDETVIGPGCRIVDSWIGSGAELKGFNYVSHTSLRNRAILEPHVRRGFD